MTDPIEHEVEPERRDDRGRAENSAGAWAAAAVVLALGGLGFGVVAQVRASELEQRVVELEQLAEDAGIVSTTLASSTVATTPVGADDADGDDVDEPIGDQPDDPAAAEAAVRHAFVTFYDGARPEADRVAVVDDPRGIADAIRAAQAGEFALDVLNAKAVVSSVRFTSASTAAATFSVMVSGVEKVSGVEGAARLVDGRWKVTRSTVCASLEDVGAPCPP